MVELDVLLGGSWWRIRRMTNAMKERFLKDFGMSKAERKKINLRGYCDRNRREIAVWPGHDREDQLNTLLHEGLHAILNEVGPECGIGWLNSQENEKVIYRLTSEILGFLKQIGAIEKPRFKA